MIIKKSVVVCSLLFIGFQIYAMDLSNNPNKAYYTDWKELERLCKARTESLAKERGMKFLAEKQYVENGRIVEWNGVMIESLERQDQEKAQKK